MWWQATPSPQAVRAAFPNGAFAGCWFDRLSRLCRAPVLSASDPLRFSYRDKLKLEMVCTSVTMPMRVHFSATANAAFSLLALR